MQDPTKIEKMLADSIAKPRMNVANHEFYKKFCDKAGVRTALVSEIEQPGAVMNACCVDRLSWRRMQTPTWSSRRARARAASFAPSRNSR